MNIYIPYKHKDGEELRYALRSIEKNLTGYDEVFLIGDKWPDWYNWANRAVVLYPDTYPNVRGRRQFNIMSKMAQVPDEKFIMWNDDHFLLKPLHVNEIKNWYEGTLKEALAEARGVYYEAVKNTCDHFGGDNRHYDVHTPCIFTNEQIRMVLNLQWGKWDYIIKSAAFHKEEGEEMKDLKIKIAVSKEAIEHLTKDRLFLSTGAAGFKQQMKEFLNERFPNKSKYEL